MKEILMAIALLVLGVASSISPIAFLMENIIDIVILVGFSIVVWLMAWTKKRLSRKEGIIMLLLYIGYMVYSCMGELWYLKQIF